MAGKPIRILKAHIPQAMIDIQSLRANGQNKETCVAADALEEAIATLQATAS